MGRRYNQGYIECHTQCKLHKIYRYNDCLTNDTYQRETAEKSGWEVVWLKQLAAEMEEETPGESSYLE